MSISGNLIGSYSPIGNTFVIVDENGNEITGVCVDNPVVFTANASEDIREGKVAATDVGVVTGEAFIPNYVTYTGTKVITKGSSFVLHMQDDCDYTKLQAIICSFNTSLTNSVAAEQVAIEDKVFAVKSTEALSSIVKDTENSLIDFGIVNTSDNMCLIRFFMYRELY